MALCNSALTQRTELVQQGLRIKQRNYELIAAENFLKPQLDLVGTYRFRGLGDHLYDFQVPIENDVLSRRTQRMAGRSANLPIPSDFGKDILV